MEIVITQNCPVNVQDIEEKSNDVGFMYSFMTGASPYFPTVKKLIEYFNTLPREQRRKHIDVIDNKKCVVIYQHVIAIRPFAYFKDWITPVGALLSTDEYYIINFS